MNVRFEFARAVLIVLYAIYSFVVVLSVVRLWGQEFFRCSHSKRSMDTTPHGGQPFKTAAFQIVDACDGW